MPPLESLDAASDVRDFLRAGVPMALRQAALRRVWRLDPTIAGFIGPADYAWDFNAPDGIPGFSPSLSGEVGRLLAQAIGARPATPPAMPPGLAPGVPSAPGEAAVGCAPPTVPAALPEAAPRDLAETALSARPAPPLSFGTGPTAPSTAAEHGPPAPIVPPFFDTPPEPPTLAEHPLRARHGSAIPI